MSLFLGSSIDSFRMTGLRIKCGSIEKFDNETAWNLVSTDKLGVNGSVVSLEYLLNGIVQV